MLNSVDDLIAKLYFIAPLQVYPEVILNKEQVYTRHDPKGNEIKITLYGHGKWVDGALVVKSSFCIGKCVISDSDSEDEPRLIKIDKIDVAIESSTNHIQFTMDLDQMECDDNHNVRRTMLSRDVSHKNTSPSNCFLPKQRMLAVSDLITTIAKMISTNNYDHSWWDIPIQSIANIQNAQFFNILKIFINNEDQSHIQKFMQTDQTIGIWKQTLHHLIEHGHVEYMRLISDESRDYLITQFTTTGEHLEFVPYLIETAPHDDITERFKL